MGQPALDVGAVLRAAGRLDSAGVLTAPQRRALRELSACRTPALGGRIEECSCCGRREYLYNSCRNRHCPTCQGRQRAAWLEREAGYLLPVEYHHLVFTLPQTLRPLTREQPRLIYGLLFESARQAVQQLAADPKYLGAQPGLVAVLHTWGQTLSLHPHVHVLATGGGLSCDRRGRLDERPVWRSSRPGFFLPVRVLGRLFRGKFIAALQQAQERGKVVLTEQWWRELYGQQWVVYSQPPCAGPAVVLKYLARYVHRVAISNGRLVRLGEEAVTFRYKDYRRSGREKEMTLPIEEFARRFLQHVLPCGFVRIRHYGLLANRGRRAKLAECRRLLAAAERNEPLPAAEEEGPRRCPACIAGVMEVVAALPRLPGGGATTREDSS